LRRLVIAILSGLLIAGCSPGGPPEDASGEEIYAELCARCHGADLAGGLGPPLGPDSDAAGEEDDYLRFTVSNGRGRMPSFASLSEAQLDRLVGHIREVQASE
jgi:cytochrome c551